MENMEQEIIENEYKQNVERKIPLSVYVVIGLLYVCVVVFTFLGTMWGFPMLVLSLGSLFMAWYLHGTARVSYEYTIAGSLLTIKRRSGMRSRPVEKDFVKLDLAKTIVAAWQGAPELDKAEAKFQSMDRKKRVTYNTSAQDVDNPSILLYAPGIGEEKGFIVKLYLQPTHQLTEILKKICPGKVFIHE